MIKLFVLTLTSTKHTTLEVLYCLGAEIPRWTISVKYL